MYEQLGGLLRERGIQSQIRNVAVSGYEDSALQREFEELLLGQGIAKYWLPDRFIFLDTPLPLQGTGKVWKLRLRERHANGEFGGAANNK